MHTNWYWLRVDITGNVVCCSADAHRPVMGSTATLMNSGSSAYGQAHGARTQVERSVANQRVTAMPAAHAQHGRADQSVPASGYRQNPSNPRQSSVTNQVSSGAGVQRGPYIPSVSTFVFLVWKRHNITCIFTWR